MAKCIWTKRWVRAAAWIILGAAVMGSDCGEGTKESIMVAGFDFVEETATAILNTLFPITAFLGG